MKSGTDDNVITCVTIYLTFFTDTEVESERGDGKWETRGERGDEDNIYNLPTASV